MELLEYFSHYYGVKTLGDIKWAHRVNSSAKLTKALQDPSRMMIESDIRFSRSGIPIAAHEPRRTSDLKFEELISRISQSNKGIKLDFKDFQVIEPCLRLLFQLKLKQLVILNADVFGKNSKAAEFVELCRNIYPQGLISLGRMGGRFTSYTEQEIDDMLEECQGLDAATFPVRAKHLKASWNQVQRLIKPENYTLTIWNEFHRYVYKETISEELKNWIKNNTDPKKTFYDLVDRQGKPIDI